jgi:hypothetical protein
VEGSCENGNELSGFTIFFFFFFRNSSIAAQLAACEEGTSTMDLVSYLSTPPHFLVTWCLMQQKDTYTFTYFKLLLKYLHALSDLNRYLD